MLDLKGLFENCLKLSEVEVTVLVIEMRLRGVDSSWRDDKSH